jgi:hypothetical protein
MIDDNSPPNTAYNFHRTVLSEELLKRRRIEIFKEFEIANYTRLQKAFPTDDSLIMSYYPSPTLLANLSKQLMIGSGLWSVCDPWCFRHPWGDLVVPTGWK